MTKPHVVGFIFARGGSKGVPRKNIRALAGKPLIAHAIEVARHSQHIERVFVSTDCPEIASIAKQSGAEVPFLRPAELATDTASEWLAWRHAILEVERQLARRIDVFVSIPTTSPLRSTADVDATIAKLLGTDSDIVITVTESHRSPYFNMVVLDEQGMARLVNPPRSGIVRRQEAPKTFDMTTVAYAARRDFVFTSDSIFAGRVQSVEIPFERAVDIDTELEFQIAEFLACQRASANLASPQRKAG